MWKGEIEMWKGMDELTTVTLQPTPLDAAYGKSLVRVFSKNIEEFLNLKRVENRNKCLV